MVPTHYLAKSLSPEQSAGLASAYSHWTATVGVSVGVSSSAHAAPATNNPDRPVITIGDITVTYNLTTGCLNKAGEGDGNAQTGLPSLDCVPHIANACQALVAAPDGTPDQWTYYDTGNSGCKIGYFHPSGGAAKAVTLEECENIYGNIWGLCGHVRNVNGVDIGYDVGGINVSTPPKGNDDPGRARADKTQNRYIIETS